jgi:hypothetical protein
MSQSLNCPRHFVLNDTENGSVAPPPSVGCFLMQRRWKRPVAHGHCVCIFTERFRRRMQCFGYWWLSPCCPSVCHVLKQVSSYTAADYMDPSLAVVLVYCSQKTLLQIHLHCCPALHFEHQCKMKLSSVDELCIPVRNFGEIHSVVTELKHVNGQSRPAHNALILCSLCKELCTSHRQLCEFYVCSCRLCGLRCLRCFIGSANVCTHSYSVIKIPRRKLVDAAVDSANRL